MFQPALYAPPTGFSIIPISRIFDAAANISSYVVGASMPIFSKTSDRYTKCCAFAIKATAITFPLIVIN